MDDIMTVLKQMMINGNSSVISENVRTFQLPKPRHCVRFGGGGGDYSYVCRQRGSKCSKV